MVAAGARARRAARERAHRADLAQRAAAAAARDRRALARPHQVQRRRRQRDPRPRRGDRRAPRRCVLHAAARAPRRARRARSRRRRGWSTCTPPRTTRARARADVDARAPRGAGRRGAPLVFGGDLNLREPRAARPRARRRRATSTTSSPAACAPPATPRCSSAARLSDHPPLVGVVRVTARRAPDGGAEVVDVVRLVEVAELLRGRRGSGRAVRVDALGRLLHPVALQHPLGADADAAPEQPLQRARDTPWRSATAATLSAGSAAMVATTAPMNATSGSGARQALAQERLGGRDLVGRVGAHGHVGAEGLTGGDRAVGQLHAGAPRRKGWRRRART